MEGLLQLEEVHAEDDVQAGIGRAGDTDPTLQHVCDNLLMVEPLWVLHAVHPEDVVLTASKPSEDWGQAPVDGECLVAADTRLHGRRCQMLASLQLPLVGRYVVWDRFHAARLLPYMLQYVVVLG
jgi:hypothetical protein